MEELKFNQEKKYCPIHGLIPEEIRLESAGGKFCGIIINDENEVCLKPLEEQINGNINQ